MYSFFRIMNFSSFYFPNFIFKIQFWICKVHFGNIYFFLRNMKFQHWKNKDKQLTKIQRSRVRIQQKLPSHVDFPRIIRGEPELSANINPWKGILSANYSVLKGQQRQIFVLWFYSSIDPIWAPVYFTNFFSNSFSNSPSYSNSKFVLRYGPRRRTKFFLQMPWI